MNKLLLNIWESGTFSFDCVDLYPRTADSLLGEFFKFDSFVIDCINFDGIKYFKNIILHLFEAIAYNWEMINFWRSDAVLYMQLSTGTVQVITM